MRLSTLLRRSLVHYWRSHVAVAIGVATCTAVVTGALLVGDSLRGSLLAAALERLGRVDYAMHYPGFFRAALADDIANAPDFARAFTQACPTIILRGSATHADSHSTAHDVTVLGVDARFWQLGAVACDPQVANAAGRSVVLNQPLADDLGARVGDDVLLRLGKAAAVSPEVLLGRRDDATLTLRLTVGGIIPGSDLGAFSLSPRQGQPRNAYVPLPVLQRALQQRDRINTVLVVAGPGAASTVPAATAALQSLFQQHAELADFGVRLRSSEEHGYVAVESDGFLLSPPVETAACDAAKATEFPASAILAYLANTISVETRLETAIPYSTVAACDLAPELLRSMTLTDGTPAPALAPGEILLNDWAARDLGANPGDSIRLSYYVTGPLGRLDMQEATFRLRGVVRLAGGAADPGFTPEYAGVTDARSLSDWNPPFPIDLRKVRDRDEVYWDEHRATPKAFISLEDGQRLWAGQHERFGHLTSFRVYGRGRDGDESLASVESIFQRELLQRLDARQLGLRVDAVRARAVAASRGTTDFAGLFVGFSFFLIVSAALLVALLFRLGVERRAGQIGLLLALGLTRRRVGRWLLMEGTVVALVGAGVGVWAAGGYAWLMLLGLRSWWAEAVNVPVLRLHAAPLSYAVGFAVGLLGAIVSIAWSLRGIARASPRALLAGIVQAGSTVDVPGPQGELLRGLKDMPTRRRVGMAPGGSARVVAMLAAGLAGVLIALSLLTKLVPPTVAFFVGGTSLLVACLAGLGWWLQDVAPPPSAVSSQPRAAGPRFTGRAAVLRLGVRNARRHRGRSLLTAGLIASATFVITALAAMRLDVSRDADALRLATGGFTLMAESAVPLSFDLNTPEGRTALNLSAQAQATLRDATFIPFRLKSGDETSCLNLYVPSQPRVLGAADVMIDRGGFAFATTLAKSKLERENPWTLLRTTLPDGSIPAIADEAAVRWQLHLDIGGKLPITDEHGDEQRLRLVALLQGSVLQGEIIVAESQFTRLFPSIAGYGFYLVDAPAGRAADVKRTLEGDLVDFGFAVTPTARRLADLFAVQNAYLSAFQALGGLGLLLGTVGLAAVLLRNVWERRGELALLRTLGFSRAALGTLVLSENAFLVGAGLLAGLGSAAVVVAPHVVMRAAPVPWGSLLGTFAAVFVAGLLAGVLALASALRAPLLPALRSE